MIRAASRGERAAGGGAFVGAASLLRFMLRRDRVSLPAWVLVLVGMSVLVAFSFTGLYPTEAERQALVATLASPAAVAMTGVNHWADDYHIGAMMGHQMLFFTTLLAGLMSLLIVVRHTRQEEATGRAELVRSAVVGRHAMLAAALATAAVANLALAAGLAIALGTSGLEGVTWGGSLLYGAAHVAVGMVFAAVAAVTAQVSEHPRGASTMAVAVLGLSYLLRALGDAANNALSWLSPLGWAQATQVYGANLPWPLGIAVIATLALVALAFDLSTRRDVGAGLRAPRPGASRASGSLTTPLGCALRLHRSALTAWAVGLLVLGVMYGSVLGEAEVWLGDIEALGGMLPQVAGVGLIESFGAMVVNVMAIIAAIYATLAALRPRAEETAGRAEPVLATGLSRRRWLASHLAIAAAGSAVVMLVGGIGLGGAAALAIGDGDLFASLLGAAAVRVPAIWVVVGVVAAAYGALPRMLGLGWAVVAYSFVVVYLGGLLQMPAAARALSPFEHVPLVPAEPFALAPLVALTLVAAALAALGLHAFGRRDVPLV